ncbi:hypothetical protein [Beijerinckia sp. L45]|jgi:hypothetical protein|uniref:hypothetical protein n=1 Tax=Beijerinckia sp. L45 TaxID=1641855 RepID=UPI00131BF863|nr:hypothetical protein [Beijerinckia sp. L45]
MEKLPHYQLVGHGRHHVDQVLFTSTVGCFTFTPRQELRNPDGSYGQDTAHIHMQQLAEELLDFLEAHANALRA